MRRLLGATAALFVSAAAGSGAPSDDSAITHGLNRIGLRARPGADGRRREIGLERHIDPHVPPERIPDAPVNARLAALTTLTMSSRQIAEQIAMPALEARREKKKNTEDAKDAEDAKNAASDGNKPKMPTPEQ